MSDFDDIRIYGTGAASDGGAQTDPDVDLGNYRCATERTSLAVLGAMERITVQRAGEANEPGVGALESDGAGSLRWTAPGSVVPGAWTAVADAATVVLPDGSWAGRAIRVLRSGAAPRAGSVALRLVDRYNGQFAGNNVAHADRVAGITVYRCVMLRNESGGALDVRIYLPAGTALYIAAEEPSAQPAGYVQTIANETTAPTGLSFVQPTSFDHADVIEKWNWTNGYILGLWLKRITAAGAAASARVLNRIIIDHMGS